VRRPQQQRAYSAQKGRARCQQEGRAEGSRRLPQTEEQSHEAQRYRRHPASQVVTARCGHDAGNAPRRQVEKDVGEKEKVGLLQQTNKASLLEVMIRGQSFQDTALSHEHKTCTVHETPLLILPAFE
jgi:hypothetical protein